MLTAEYVRKSFLDAKVYVTKGEAENFTPVVNSMPDPEAFLAEEIRKADERLNLWCRQCLRDQEEEESCD